METILVRDDEVDFKMYPMSGWLSVAGVVTFLLLIFKIFGIGYFATANWTALALPFAVCGFVLFIAQIWR